MTQTAAELVIGTGRGARRVRLDEHLTPEAAERAESAAIDWIKAMRHARVDGSTFRDRFTHRGDSLWWFAELYFHKRQVIARALDRRRRRSRRARGGGRRGEPRRCGVRCAAG
jgi:hypothetical protein